MEKLKELQADLENEISGLRLQVKKKQEEQRTLKRECELLDERRFKLMDFVDKIKDDKVK